MLLASLFLLCISCTNTKLWGQTREELFFSLQTRDYRFFDAVDTGLYQQVLTLGNEAPYYFALHLINADRIPDARKMLALGVAKSPALFRLLCLKELIRIGTPEEKLAAIEQLLASPKQDSGTDIPSLENMHSELLLSLGRFTDFPTDIPSWYYDHSMSDELVSAFPLLPSVLPVAFKEITVSRIEVFHKEYASAWLHAKAILERGGTEVLHRSVLSDFGKAALYGSADYLLDAAFLDRKAQGLHESIAQDADQGAARSEAAYMLMFYAGRLYAHGGKTERLKAENRFEEAMKIAPAGQDYDNALWYLLDTVKVDGPSSVFSVLEKYAPAWKNPGVFSEFLDSLIVTLVQKRDWKRIVELRKILSDYSDQEIQVRLDYLAARSNILSADDTRTALTRAFEGDHGSLYYRVLSAEVLDLPIGAPDSIIAKIKKRPSAGPEADAAMVLRGFIKFKLPQMVYPYVVKMYPSLSGPLAAELNNALTEAGQYSEALRLSILTLRSADTPITDEDLKLIYPRPWLKEVSEAAARFNIPEYLLYALIRSESFFQSDVVSGAGAIGLTQLMVPTASDIARKLKFESFDLLDPATNSAFGAYYLSEMIRRLDGRILPSLFAYNAGISRVRIWQKDAAGLKDDLFLETLPYAETREYGRKVLAAASVYGYLYYQKTTGQIVRELF